MDNNNSKFSSLSKRVTADSVLCGGGERAGWRRLASGTRRWRRWQRGGEPWLQGGDRRSVWPYPYVLWGAFITVWGDDDMHQCWRVRRVLPILSASPSSLLSFLFFPLLPAKAKIKIKRDGDAGYRSPYMLSKRNNNSYLN